MNERKLNSFLMFLRRMPGEWWLCGETLKHWITHRGLKFFNNTPGIALSCSPNVLHKYCENNDIDINETSPGIHNLPHFKHLTVVCNQEITHIISSDGDDRELLKSKRRNDLSHDGFWQARFNQESPYKVQLPYKTGTYLDMTMPPLWWVGNDHCEDDSQSVWFTPERKHHGYELLSIMLECGERAGIRHAMFLAFGNMLGYVKFGDFINSDTDLDLCINTDKVTTDQLNKYLEEIKKPFKIKNKVFPHGLCENMYRFSNKREDNGNPTWISIGHRSIMNDNGVKSCNWFMFEHSNHFWHTKGDHWVNAGGFGEIQSSKYDKAICLGQPSSTLNQFTEVDFHGVAINIPTNAGACLDWWYPGWHCSQKGSSLRRRYLIIPDWNNKSNWRMI